LVVALTCLAGQRHAAFALAYEPKSTNEFFAKINPRLAPAPGPLFLQQGDRLAIIGDSITEQRMYSRIIETYLTACVPQLQISVRQYGWSGETAEGFRKRMTNDCLRFQPTVATLCYGMNDHRYRPYDAVNAAWYASNYTAVVKALRGAGARVVLGSPGCMSKVAQWRQIPGMTLDEDNIHLCALRDIGIGIAEVEGARFADVFWTMFQAEFEGKSRFGTPEQPFMIGGKDGVHPGWEGHLAMAYAFLRAMGLEGDLGTVTVDLAAKQADAGAGHRVESLTDGVLALVSERYPFSATGDADRDAALRMGMAVVPFAEHLNRFRLVVKGGTASSYRVTWGPLVRTYTGEQLSSGVNLAAEFELNPFSEAFKRVDDAVGAKQAYETAQIKKIFHGEEGKQDMEAAVKRTEAERAPLAAAIHAAMVPVRHTIRIEPIQ
jgi:lysophospholipase L1-like esterase